MINPNDISNALYATNAAQSTKTNGAQPFNLARELEIEENRKL